MYFINDLKEDLEQMLLYQKEIELRKYKVKLSILERDIYAKTSSLTNEDKQIISELFKECIELNINDGEED